MKRSSKACRSSGGETETVIVGRNGRGVPERSCTAVEPESKEAIRGLGVGGTSEVGGGDSKVFVGTMGGGRCFGERRAANFEVREK